jgi:Kdo2-lipid IVA lauroyltransferase/acyltransferase
MKKILQALSYYLSLPFILLISILPWSILYGISNLLYIVLYKILKYRVAVVRQNIYNSFPQKNYNEKIQLEADFYRILADYMVEGVKSFTISKKQVLKLGTIVPNNDMYALAVQGRNIIISAGHVANQELANLYLSANKNEFPFQVKAAYHSLSNPYFDGLFHRSRTRFGTEMYSMRATYDAIAKQKLNSPFAYILLNDQSAPPQRAHWVQFLQQDTSFYKGMAVFAQQYDMPVYYLHVRRNGRGTFELSFKNIAKQPKTLTNTQILDEHVRLLEANILEDPKTWLWSHRRWKHKR